MSWQVIPQAVVEVRRRWRDAPPRLGPFSRHPRSVDLLRHARADVATLLAHLDLTRRDPLGELCYELARLGATDIEVRAVRPLAGERGLYEVRWLDGSSPRPVLRTARGWSPCVAARKAVRLSRAAQTPDSDAMAGRGVAG